jgi:hypothetical protein
MATVQSLSTALKKTSDEVIEILVNAGIEGKTANSEISGDERKILMAGLSKRGSAKSSISVSRKPSTKSSDGTGGVKIQVKKKRPIQAPITPVQDDAAVLKAKEALEAGLDAWHLSQFFSSRPSLSLGFVQDQPPFDRVVAVPSEPTFLVSSVISSVTNFDLIQRTLMP